MHAPRSARSLTCAAAMACCAAAAVLHAALSAPASLALATSTARAGAPADRFVGVYSNDTLRLELTAANGGGLRGTITVGELALPVTAAADGEGIRGEFTSDGHAFAFTASLEGDTLVLESDGALHRLRKQKAAPANPLAKPPGSAPRGPAETPPAPGAAGGQDELGRTVSHAVGVTLRCPEGWRVQSSMGSLVLIPDDAPRDAAGGPGELYVLLYAPAPGATSIKDPGLAERLAGEVTEMMPNLRRDGKAEFIDLGDRPAAALRFKGRADDGREVRASAHVTVHDGIAVGLFGVGEEAAMARRGGVAERIFKTATFAAPQRDGSLVGAWSYTESYSDPGSGFSMATQHTVELRADGRYEQRSKVAGGTDAVTGSSGGEGSGGRWYADRESIILIGDEGDVTPVGYSLSGGRLVTTDATGARQIWTR